MAEQYPDAKKFIYGTNEDTEQDPYSAMLDYSDRHGGWANSNGNGKIVVEYKDSEGTYVFLPENRKIIDYMENPLKSGPCFVIAKRFSFRFGKVAQSHGNRKLHVLGSFLNDVCKATVC